MTEEERSLAAGCVRLAAREARTARLAAGLDADDAVSEALLALCLAAPSHDPARGRATTLFTVSVRRRVWGWRSREYRDPTRLAAAGSRELRTQLAREGPRERFPEDAARAAGELKLVRAALGEGLFALAEARWGLGLTLRELAEKFGLTPGQVAGKLRRARNLARACREAAAGRG